MPTRKTIAKASRSPLIIDDINQTFPLKKTRVVSSTTGSARTARPPTEVRCDNVMRIAQPTTDPTPQPVRTMSTAAVTNTSGRCDGPISTTMTTPTMVTATVDAIAR